jgi:lysophospholipase L1-like esterase
MRRLLPLIALPLLVAAAPHAEDRHGLPDLTVHDFAAKYLMQQGDLADLHVYASDNATLTASSDGRPRIVLIGDSITFHWEAGDRPAPARWAIINRGIVGQNSDQMLLRFENDVIALKPVAVAISAGANDARIYVGAPADARAATIARIARNVTAMADMADAHRIRVVISAITPCHGCAALNRDPATIAAANDWLKRFSAERHYAFADYYKALADAQGELPADLTRDGLHPLPPGYARMWAELSRALDDLHLDRR